MKKLLKFLLNSKLGRAFIQQILSAFYLSIIQYLIQKSEQLRDQNSMAFSDLIVVRGFLRLMTQPSIQENFVNRFQDTGHLDNTVDQL